MLRFAKNWEKQNQVITPTAGFNALLRVVGRDDSPKQVADKFLQSSLALLDGQNSALGIFLKFEVHVAAERLLGLGTAKHANATIGSGGATIWVNSQLRSRVAEFFGFGINSSTVPLVA